MEKIKKYMSTKTVSQKLFFVIFLVIFLVGIFLRTYNFHDWLRFENDQVRDAITTEQILSGEKPLPLLGPTMRASGETKETLFRVGPVYYYFQIFSATVFGIRADVMAYPDLFFGILSIPLLLYFFKRYFISSISLFLTALYSVSFFAIRYSRFAWNPNVIPFFVILFLISAHEFLIRKEKVSYFWVSMYGIALGIGIQLHATMLPLLSLAWLIIAIYLLIRKKDVWRKLIVVLLLALLINIPQIVSEQQTGFANSRALFHFSEKNDSPKNKVPFLSILADTASCHIESNANLLFSFGQEECNYSYVKIWEKNRAGNTLRETVFWPELIAIFLFSLLGYFLLGYRFYKEQDISKKYFLSLVIIFSMLFFFLMLPITRLGFKEFRYFSPVFFVPFVFFGIVVDFFIQKRKKVYVFIVILMGAFVVTTNAYSLYGVTKQLSEQKGNNGHTVFLGEVEKIVHYMKDISGSSEKIYVMSQKIYTGNIFLPGTYVAKQYGYNLIRISDLKNVLEGMPVFFLAENSENSDTSAIRDIPIKSVRNFGGIRVYQLEY